jgi:hypothetical protein
MPEQVADWNGRPITIARSKKGVRAVCDFTDNLIREDRLPWPPPPVVQKLYESIHSRSFEGVELAACKQRLGFYSDIQSLNSEDAITWSYFGPFLAETSESRAAFLNWLLEEVGLAELAGGERCGIDLWRRIPHPDPPISPGGPELDVVLDGDQAVVFLEAKWRSKEGARQGRTGTKTQLELRRDFLGVIGPRVYGDRGFVVCGDPVDPSPRRSWRRVVGWQRMAGRRASGEHGGSDIALREPLDEWACPTCIDRLRAGIDVRQASLL